MNTEIKRGWEGGREGVRNRKERREQEGSLVCERIQGLCKRDARMRGRGRRWEMRGGKRESERAMKVGDWEFACEASS